MPLNPHAPAFIQSRWFRLGGLFFMCTAILFPGFYRNQWDVVRDKKFKEFQLDSESLVIARMVESRQHGLLSQNGLLGWGDVNPLDLNQSDYENQYDIFLSGGTFNSYSLYKSASGAQGLIFSVLQQVSPLTPAMDLRNFRGLLALLLAAVISAYVLWTFQEFGLVTAIFVVATAILSHWITLFGRNLFYFIWASFLPLVLMTWYLDARARQQRAPGIGLATVAFAGILFKCLVNGYDFIIPALSMPVIPLVYYALRDGWHGKAVARQSAILILGMGAAVAVSILILAVQLRASEGSFIGGLSSIFSTFNRRTYADPDLFPAYAESLQANPWLVLWTYFTDDSAIGVLGITFGHLAGVLAAVTGAYIVLVNRWPERFTDTQKSKALIIATWMSFLSPISWFLLFKGQAYVHTHTNYLAWHMPFTLFGYAMLAWIIQNMSLLLLHKNRATACQGTPRTVDRPRR
jgi:hypothetical protein